jgi:hypothetical protein
LLLGVSALLPALIHGESDLHDPAEASIRSMFFLLHQCDNLSETEEVRLLARKHRVLLEERNDDPF